MPSRLASLLLALTMGCAGSAPATAPAASSGSGAGASGGGGQDDALPDERRPARPSADEARPDETLREVDASLEAQQERWDARPRARDPFERYEGLEE